VELVVSARYPFFPILPPRLLLLATLCVGWKQGSEHRGEHHSLEDSPASIASEARVSLFSFVEPAFLRRPERGWRKLLVMTSPRPSFRETRAGIMELTKIGVSSSLDRGAGVTLSRSPSLILAQSRPRERTHTTIGL
jgi:hypothetical protein